MTTPQVQRPIFGGATGNSAISTTTQPTDSTIRYVDDMLEYLEVDDFPLQKAIGYGEPINVRKVEWADRRRAPTADALGAAVADGVGTSITVANGVRFQQYQVIKIDDEVLLVTAIAGNTLTVTRGWGSTGAAHANGAVIRIIGVAMPENTDTPPAPFANGGFYYNFFQLFDSAIEVSNRANAGGEANYLIRRKEYNLRVEEKFIEKAEQLEYTLFHGTRVDASGALPSTMGGLPAYITEHVTDLSGAALRKTDLKEIWQAAYADVGKAAMAKTAILGAFQKEVFNSFFDPARRIDGTTKNITDYMDAIDTDFGRMTFMMHWHCPADDIYGVKLSNLSLHPFGDYGRWHDKRLPESGPYMKGRITGDYTLKAKGDRAHWKIVNSSIVRGDYPSLAE